MRRLFSLLVLAALAALSLSVGGGLADDDEGDGTGASAYVVVTGDGVGRAFAQCPPGMVPTGGGFSIKPAEPPAPRPGDPVPPPATDSVQTNRPNGSGWLVGTFKGDTFVTAFAVCAAASAGDEDKDKDKVEDETAG